MCLQCDSSQITCSSCGGFFSAVNNTCTLINDHYTCLNLLTGLYKEPIWDGLKCFDCDSSQYVCNKECFRVWTDQSCQSTSCDTD